MASRLSLPVVVVVAMAALAAARPPPRQETLIRSSDKSDPRQVHISLAGNNSMRITWITEKEGSSTTVEYGKSSKNYTFKAYGETTRYKYVTYNSGEIHHTVIGPVDAGAEYFYRCGGQGPEFKLKTAPSRFPVTVAVVGDLGQTKWTNTTLAHIRESPHDVFILPGDLSYADYIQPLWDKWGELVQGLASSTPWMVTQGNHKIEKIPVLETSFQAYNARWKMPYKESNSSSNLYYSWDVAGVHVIMLGCYTRFDVGSEQYQWLKADFAKVNRRKTPWLITVIHAPWYNSNWDHQGEGDNMMAAIEPLLHAPAVDVVFAGHVHAYERSKRVFKGNSDPCGAVHITVGGGGNREGLAKKYINLQPSWSLFREASFGHGRFNIVNSTHALWSYHRNNDDINKIVDQVWITSLASSRCLAHPSLNHV